MTDFVVPKPSNATNRPMHGCRRRTRRPCARQDLRPFGRSFRSLGSPTATRLRQASLCLEMPAEIGAERVVFYVDLQRSRLTPRESPSQMRSRDHGTQHRERNFGWSCRILCAFASLREPPLRFEEIRAMAQRRKGRARRYGITSAIACPRASRGAGTPRSRASVGAMSI